MRKLTPEYQQVLWLIYFEELSNKEAAKIMKKSVRSVESLLYRARKSLKSQLEMEGFDYENYEDMAKDVLHRIDEYERKKNEACQDD